MRGRVWAVVVALLVGGILALVVPTWAHSPSPAARERHANQADLTRWSGGADPGLHVMPFPGTPDASPVTRVIFSALTPPDVRRVRVVGSQSGRHTGHLTGLPDGAGTAFVPDRPFAAREAVKVTAVLRSDSAGTASGARGARRLSFSFAVAAPVRLPVTPPAPPPAHHAAAASRGKPGAKPSSQAAQTAGHSYPSEQHFRSMPGLGPPVVRTTRDGDDTSGDILLTPSDTRQHGPMIVNPRGQLVWFDHITNRLAVYNLEVKTYRGRPVLTWWQGKFEDAHGIDGQGVIMNSAYHIVQRVRAGDGYTSDLHEFQVTPQGTAWVDCYVPVKANLTSRGGSAHGTVLDGVVQKIDVRTGRVLWEWHSLGHVPIGASYIGAAGGGQYDYFHLNSIQELPNGKVLVSARNTWAVYEIDERTGRIDWTLGGKDSDFRFGPGAEFAWQHDVTLHRNGVITVFDNADVPQREPASSAKELRINPASRTVSLIRRYAGARHLLVSFMGSAQILPNHRVLVGWGNTENFTEYSASGEQIFSGRFPDGVNSYRVYRFPWHGQPSTPPAMSVSPDPDGAMKVYSAWNGATDVARWQVLGGAAPNALVALLGQSASRGFETGQRVPAEPRYFAVEALDSRGRMLGRSAPFARPASVAVYGQQAFVSATSGSGGLPVACFTKSSRTCAVRGTIKSGRSILARTASEPLPADSIGLLSFRLSSVGRALLAASHHLTVQVIAQDSAGHAARRLIELIPFAGQGAGPEQSTTGSPTVELLGTIGFASSDGQGSLLAACYAAVRCELQGDLSVGGRRIATVSRATLGASEAGYLSFQLTAAGRAMLASAPGNRLGVRARLSNGTDLATGQISLVRYS